ncbi:uncharacterized protein LOC113522371 [Galleria mellonella]|uniref:Uncharacterized protein LOC113522371 n=1 Tax=Galleria mellonella TaxID=7137 RepID=A0A6J3C9B6_GALME|nr:uncharacterized protein LOC113522371 [Galleria mellonella]
MYIAFKWLIGLCSVMWIMMCSVDIYLKKSKEIRKSDVSPKMFGFVFENTTMPVKQITRVHVEKFNVLNSNQKQNMAILHYMTFLAGAFIVFIYNKKKEIILCTKYIVAKINLYMSATNLKKSAIINGVAMIKFLFKIWVIVREVAYKFIKGIYTLKAKRNENQQKINIILLKKLKEIGEERKNLGQILIAAIHENKNIRLQYQLQSMAKNRLLRHIDDTQKKIKESRSRYVSFQHLYLVTHEENIFLKARVRKLSLEKEDAEKNLLRLIKEIYKTKNTELKTYCSRFIIRTNDNLLNSDVKAEIQKFLENPRRHTTTVNSNRQFSLQSPCKINDTKTLSSCSHSNITENMLQEIDNLIPLVSDAPRLKGLPGEYIWTVKDKDGIIEKLYEYDYESDFDNGDIIRRIRQYSVYFDKDCLLDCINSRSVICGATDTGIQSAYATVNYPIASKRFLTGSEIFKKFLQDTNNIVPSSNIPKPPLLFV